MTDPMTDRELAACPLLPCPWCGGSLREVSVSEGSTFRWRKVDGCCADGPEVRHNTMADDQAAAEAESRQRAIDAWNNRPTLLSRTPAGEDARDAERYRWLRDLPNGSPYECIGNMPGDRWDDEIDAAMENERAMQDYGMVG